MIPLKSCLEGKAEEAISKLGFSEEAYKEAKNTSKRRFGGERRQLQNYLEDVNKIKPLQEGSIQELEKFADILVSIVVTLHEHNRPSELEPGSLLFSLVVEKILKTMLSRYFRWASENHRLESLETLRDWITEESTTKLKLWKVLRGSELKQSTKKTTVERTVPLLRLEEDEKKRLNFSENAIFVKVIMGSGRVSSLKMQMSMRDGESLKTRDYVFVVYVTVTKGRTASDRENVEKTAAEEVITDYFIQMKNLETGEFLLTLKVYQILPHHLQGPSQPLQVTSLKGTLNKQPMSIRTLPA